MQSLENEIKKLHEELNNSKNYNLNIKSIGFTTYFFNLEREMVKMKTFSYETQDYKDINNRFIQEYGSILSIEDFNKSESYVNNEEYKISSKPIYKRNVYFSEDEEAFDFDIQGVLQIQEQSKVNFSKWVDFLKLNTNRDLFCVKYTSRKPIGDYGDFLGISIFLISDGRSGKKKDLGNLKNDLREFCQKGNVLYQFLEVGFAEYAQEISIRTNKLKKSTIKSSLASIIARGMSHTDGSHSMKYFEESFLEFVKQNTDANTIATLFETYNQHLRHVMELTADITGGIGNQTSYAFSFGAILKKFQVLYFPEPDEDDDYSSICILSKPIVDNEKNCVLDCSKLENKKVLLPGGINGTTALLQILKNIYRNIFKHNLTSVKGQSISLSIEIQDLDKDNSLHENYYLLLITENVETDEKKFKDLERHVKQSILNEDDEVDENCWGIKEIKIQAAYMIGLAIERLNDDDYSLNKIFNKSNPWYFIEHNSSKQIEHKFYLKKEKKALVIVDNSELESLNTRDNNNKGLYYIFLNKDKKEQWYNYINRDFKYVIFQDKISSKSRNFKLISYSGNPEEFDLVNIDENWLKSLQKEHLDGNKYLLDKSHSENLIEKKSGYKKDDKKIKQIIWDDLNYYEPLKPTITYNDYETKLCMLTNIALLDERLQKELWKSEYQHIHKMVDVKGKQLPFTKVQLLEKRGIFTPNIEVGNQNLYSLFYGKKLVNEGETLNRDSTDKDFKEFINLLKYYFKDKDCAYVIVHFSGLEVLANGLSKGALKKIEKKLKKKRGVSGLTLKNSSKLDKVYSYLIKVKLGIQGSGKYLLLTSGKGTPKTLPNHSYFINLNNVEYLLNTKGITKLDFIKTLECIRQIKN